MSQDMLLLYTTEEEELADRDGASSAEARFGPTLERDPQPARSSCSATWGQYRAGGSPT